MALSLSPKEIIDSGNYPLLIKAKHWERIKIELIAEVQNGFAFSSEHFSLKEGMPLIRIRDILRSRTEHFYLGDYNELFLVLQNDILIGMDGDFNVSRWKGPVGLLNQRVCRIKLNTNLYDDKFLFLCLQPYLNAINSETSSVTVKHLSSRTIQETPLPLPPLNEQKRIVNKIEELLSELDHAVESFKKIQQQLKIYRQAVLKAAFEGKLATVSPAATLNSSSFEKFIPEEQEQNFNIDLPDPWILTRLKYLVNNVEYGSSYKSLKEGRVAVLRMGNIQNLKFDWNDLVFSSNEEEIQKYKLKKGDVLFNRTNSPELVGKTALYNGEQEAIFAGYLIRINYIKEILNPKYLNYYLNSFHAKKYGSYVKTDGVNQSNINGTKLKQYPIPICSLEEQNQIVQEIESRLSICDELEKTIEQNLILEKSLRQSILKKAFEGKLVPQDPNDEPAELLLGKIKLEKEKLANSSQTKTKREKVTA
jgi:type I restriction enzyme S subunit